MPARGLSLHPTGARMTRQGGGATLVASDSRSWTRPRAPNAVDLPSLPPHIWVRSYGRDRIQEKLRISLTEHCNLACFFCHNEGQGPIRRQARERLTIAEIVSVARTALAEGATKIKLTGGEPLLFRSGRDNIITLVREISALRQDGRSFDLSMTTNGSLLPEYAHQLASVGLDRVTISLTTLDDKVYDELISPNQQLLSRGLEGLHAARDAGLLPLKINTPLCQSKTRGVGNLHELPNLTATAIASGAAELRFYTLLWHENFPEFGDFYQFFSPEMRNALVALLKLYDVVGPSETVETLARLALRFAHRAYPKVEYGVDLGSLKIGFEAMKYGRLSGRTGLQEGPYAVRLSADGALRATLGSEPSYGLLRGIQERCTGSELRRLYRAVLEEMP